MVEVLDLFIDLVILAGTLLAPPCKLVVYNPMSTIIHKLGKYALTNLVSSIRWVWIQLNFTRAHVKGQNRCLAHNEAALLKQVTQGHNIIADG